MGKCKYNRLPMGIKIALDVFQYVMAKVVEGMEYVKTYLDDLLTITNSIFKDHLTNSSFIDQLLKIKIVLVRLSSNESLV
jgi:hypothetical protein